MNILNLTADFPETGPRDLLWWPGLAEARRRLHDDFAGSQSFHFGGALLFPYANRIRGRAQASHQEIEIDWGGEKYLLPANHLGKLANAEKCAIHGLILNQVFQSRLSLSPNDSEITGHQLFRSPAWPSEAKLEVTATLKKESFHLRFSATNVGQKPMPVGMGWHPYWKIPSGKRAQVTLKIPARSRLLVDNYDNVFPTGKLEPLASGPYDFSKAKSIGELYLDECFVDLERNHQGHYVIELVDAAADYGLRVTCFSPSIQAVQVYSPVDSDFVAIEPQFNRVDPFSKIWAGHGGMEILAPGAVAEYAIKVDVFQPSLAK